MLIVCCSSARRSVESTLRPNSAMDDGLSPGAQLTSPSDMVGPSPVTSNGTETTEIEDEIADEVASEISERSTPQKAFSVDSQATVSAANWIGVAGMLIDEQLKRISTNLPDLRASLDDESISVIHAPEGFKDFVSLLGTQPVGKH